MKTVIIISKCLKVSKNGELSFHFKGFVAGQVIEKVLLINDKNLDVQKGREYLMYAQITKHKDGVLSGILLKAKDITDQDIAA